MFCFSLYNHLLDYRFQVHATVSYALIFYISHSATVAVRLTLLRKWYGLHVR